MKRTCSGILVYYLVEIAEKVIKEHILMPETDSINCGFDLEASFAKPNLDNYTVELLYGTSLRRREMLTTHFLTHTFFDWLKFTSVPPNHMGLISIWWDPCRF